MVEVNSPSCIVSTEHLLIVVSRHLLILIGVILAVIFGLLTAWAIYIQHLWLQLAFACVFCICVFITPVIYLKMKFGDENVNQANRIILAMLGFLVIAMVIFWVFSIVSAPEWMKEGSTGLFGGIVGAFIYEVIPKKKCNECAESPK